MNIATVYISKMTTNYCIVRYHGKIYRVLKSLFETEERAQDRAWYIAKKLQSEISTPVHHAEYEAIVNESHIYINKKYFQMEY